MAYKTQKIIALKSMSVCWFIIIGCSVNFYIASITPSPDGALGAAIGGLIVIAVFALPAALLAIGLSIYLIIKKQKAGIYFVLLTPAVACVLFIIFLMIDVAV